MLFDILFLSSVHCTMVSNSLEKLKQDAQKNWTSLWALFSTWLRTWLLVWGFVVLCLWVDLSVVFVVILFAQNL